METSVGVGRLGILLILVVFLEPKKEEQTKYKFSVYIHKCKYLCKS